MNVEQLADELYERIAGRIAKSSKYNRADKGTGSPELGAIIREFRGPVSLRVVAAATGLHHGFIGRLERGERGASTETIARLTGYFGPEFALVYLDTLLRLVDPDSDRPTGIADQQAVEAGAVASPGDEGGDDAPSSTVYRAGSDARGNAVRAWNMVSEQKYAV